MAELIQQAIDNAEALVAAGLALYALYQKIRRHFEGKAFDTVVQGVERGTSRLGAGQAKAFKREIQDEAFKAGTEGQLAKRVRKLTGGK